MITQHEKSQLIKDHERTPVSVLGMLLTCAAGLLLVVLVALLGMDIHRFDEAADVKQATVQSR